MTERTILLFDSTCEPLGECSVIGGCCSSICLNERGERLIGRVMEKMTDPKIQEFMPFTEVLREWADHSGMSMVSFPSDRISVWHQIVAMPLTAFDRYALAFAISQSSRRQQEIWTEMLSKVS